MELFRSYPGSDVFNRLAGSIRRQQSRLKASSQRDWKCVRQARSCAFIILIRSHLNNCSTSSFGREFSIGNRSIWKRFFAKLQLNKDKTHCFSNHSVSSWEFLLGPRGGASVAARAAAARVVAADSLSYRARLSHDNRLFESVNCVRRPPIATAVTSVEGNRKRANC